MKLERIVAVFSTGKAAQKFLKKSLTLTIESETLTLTIENTNLYCESLTLKTDRKL